MGSRPLTALERAYCAIEFISDYASHTMRITCHPSWRDDHVYISHFSRQGSFDLHKPSGSYRHGLGANKGCGANVLRLVCRVADRYGIPLELHTTAKPLIPYYERFGFQPVEWHGIALLMRRGPT